MTKKRKRCKAEWETPSQCQVAIRRCRRLAKPGKRYCDKCREAKARQR